MASEQKQLKMGYKFLGKTGLKVSEICLGAMTFGTSDKNGWGLPTCNEETSFALLDKFVEYGGNFIDTANNYGPFESELVLGKWLASKPAKFRDSLIIATKVRGQIGLGPNDIGLSRKHILDSVEASLKRLQTSYIDLFQCHFYDYKTPLEETLSTLNNLVQSGKVRYVGISNFTAAQIVKALNICRKFGWEPVVCLQPQYSLICRHIEWEILPTCIEEGLGVIPWSPLGGGLLSGRYKRGMAEPPAGTRVAWAEDLGWAATDWKSHSDDKMWNIVDELFKIAEEVGGTPAQVALRWVMQKPGVTAPIIGARTLQQLEDNVKAAFIQLTSEQMERLDKLTETALPYPYNFLLSRAQRS